ncbi:O-antigen ligase family protein [Clostridium perfringens]|nr:O-antigen ligase family protein [Clostridium perfringens]
MVILVGITLVTMFNNKKDFINFFYFWILGALISSIYSIVYFYQQGFDFNQIFTVSNDSIKQFYDMKFSSSPLFEDPNNFASYLLISILITIGVKKYNYINKNNKKSITICLVIQVLALIITLSRSAYIGLVIAILVNLTLDKKFKVLKGILFFLLMIAIILGAINIFNTDYSAMSRIALWETAVNMSINNPIFGVGLANFPIYFLKYLKGNILMMNPHPHNLFLRISAETGIVGLFLFINIYLEPIKNFLFYKNKKNINYNLQRYLILGMIAFFVQSIGVEYLASRHFWIVTSLILLNEKLKIA